MIVSVADRPNIADPGAAGGIDLDSDTIIQIAQESSNICGVKLT